MKYIAAYALAWLGGKAAPSAKDLEGIIKAAGGEFDAGKAGALIEALKDKSVNEIITSGRTKLNGISLGSGSAAAPAAAVATKTEVAETKDDKKGDDEDAAMEGGMGLFGDEEW